MHPAAAQPGLASWLHQLQGHAVGQHISPLSLGLLNRKRRINLHQLKAYGEGQIHVRHVLQRSVCHYFLWGEEQTRDTRSGEDPESKTSSHKVSSSLIFASERRGATDGHPSVSVGNRSPDPHGYRDPPMLRSLI